MLFINYDKCSFITNKVRSDGTLNFYCVKNILVSLIINVGISHKR